MRGTPCFLMAALRMLLFKRKVGKRNHLPLSVEDAMQGRMGRMWKSVLMMSVLVMGVGCEAYQTTGPAPLESGMAKAEAGPVQRQEVMCGTRPPQECMEVLAAIAYLMGHGSWQCQYLGQQANMMWSNGSLYYAGHSDDYYGQSVQNGHEAWLYDAAFSGNTVANTIAHEMAHTNENATEQQATLIGNSCGP